MINRNKSHRDLQVALEKYHQQCVQEQFQIIEYDDTYEVQEYDPNTRKWSSNDNPEYPTLEKARQYIRWQKGLDVEPI